MHIYTSREALLQGVSAVQRAVASKTTMPILSGIKLETVDDKLIFSATDLEIAIQATINITTITSGAVVVPAKYFTEMVRKLPDTKIEIKVDELSHQLTVMYGNSQLKLNGYDPQAYPLIPQIEADKVFSIRSELLRQMLKQVIFAVGVENNRPVFQGILFDCYQDNLTLVATDTHRLAMRKGKWSQGNVEEFSAIVPGKTMNELLRLLPEEEEVKLSFSQNQLAIQLPNIIMFSRLIEGQFPAYKQVIPSQWKSRLRVKTRELLETAERATLLAQDGTSTIKLIVKQYQLEVNSASSSVGTLKEEIPIYLEGEETQITFNTKYLIDVLRNLDSEELTMDLTGSISPGIIRPLENENYLYLLLPLRQ
ncbi:DNA polymerase-3 subunit beta [Carboxydocella sporoproducens DSM 16521]|uniref:Beta sliding clamp n=2 Tax=Carboxydocella TaxID=178898 RepID=A0A1T4SBI7_9FIRM|nr:MULTISPECIES: DNA polymerase III subunit beta [Carboxydocella]AVX19221.1 DNA polymerase III, beta subunit [Carboxydocella thermautotrophica]GAW30214.1 DNA polymerase III subunit beta [Carboxydocella sp. ULO1]SKA25547.1 DNA polymerase-3 subunit beta [Carboxydocella sporoproducens DSM 16521]